MKGLSASTDAPGTNWSTDACFNAHCATCTGPAGPGPANRAGCCGPARAGMTGDPRPLAVNWSPSRGLVEPSAWTGKPFPSCGSRIHTGKSFRHPERVVNWPWKACAQRIGRRLGLPEAAASFYTKHASGGADSPAPRVRVGRLPVGPVEVERVREALRAVRWRGGVGGAAMVGVGRLKRARFDRRCGRRTEEMGAKSLERGCFQGDGGAKCPHYRLE
jgi:hypothetical protein